MNAKRHIPLTITADGRPAEATFTRTFDLIEARARRVNANLNSINKEALRAARDVERTLSANPQLTSQVRAARNVDTAVTSNAQAVAAAEAGAVKQATSEIEKEYGIRSATLKSAYLDEVRASKQTADQVVADERRKEAAFKRTSEEERRVNAAQHERLRLGSTAPGSFAAFEQELLRKDSSKDSVADIARAEKRRAEVRAIELETRRQAQYTEDLINKSKAAEDKLASSALKAEQSLQKTTSALGRASGEAGGFTARISAMAEPIAAVATGVAVAVGVIVALGTALFNLVKGVADIGEKLFNLAQRTHLSAGFLSVLKVEAEQSGSTVEASAAKLVKFNNGLVDAANGSKKLTVDLQAFGIDAKEAVKNPEQALVTFIQRYNELPDGIRKSRLEATLFKDRTGEAIPVIRALGTDIEGLKKNLTNVWTQQELNQADKFNDKLKGLNQTIEGVKKEIAIGAMPAIERAVTDTNASLSENQKKWREWGETIGSVVTATQYALTAFKYFLISPMSPFFGVYWITVGIRWLGIGDSIADSAASKLRGPFMNAGITRMKQGLGSGGPGWETNKESIKDGGGGGKHKGGVDDAAQAAIKAAELDLQFAEDTYKKSTATTKREYDLRNLSLDAFVRQQLDAEKTLYDKKLSALTAEEQAALRLSKGTARETKQREINLKRQQIETEFYLKSHEIQDNATKTEEDALRSHLDAQMNLLDSYDLRMLDSYQAMAENGVSTQQAYEQQVLDIKTKAYDRKLELLSAEEAANVNNLQEFQRINDEITKLVGDQAAFQEQQERRIEAARQKDIENLRQYNEQVRNLELDNLRTAIEIGRRKLDEMEKLGVSRKYLKQERRREDLLEIGLDYRRDVAAENRRDAGVSRHGLDPSQLQRLDYLHQEALSLARESYNQRLQEFDEAPIIERLEKIRGVAASISESIVHAFSEGWRKGPKVFADQTLKTFENLFQKIIQEWLKSKIESILLKLFNPSAPGAAGGGGSSGGFSFGNILQSIRNLFSGGGSGAGNAAGAAAGTVTAGGSIVSEGMAGLGLASGLSGLGAFAAPSAAAALTGGVGAGVATGGAVSAFAAPSAIAALGGSGAAAGTAGAGGAAAGGGAGIFGSLTPLLTNPWTAVAVGAAVGGFLLWRHFHKNDEKKIQDAVRARYGISIDKNVASQIKQIGQGLYGKNYLSHLNELLGRDEVKQIISDYAESTGQNAKGLTTSAQYTDAGFRENLFFAGTPGSVPASGFVIGSNGQSTASTPNSTNNNGNRQGGLLQTVMAALVGEIRRLNDNNEQMETISPGELLQKGARENPRAIGEAIIEHGSSDSSFNDRLGRNLNLDK